MKPKQKTKFKNLSEIKREIEEVRKGCGEVESLGRSPCSKDNLCDECEVKLEKLKVLQTQTEGFCRLVEELIKDCDLVREYPECEWKMLHKLLSQIQGGNEK